MIKRYIDVELYYKMIDIERVAKWLKKTGR